jgi:hypothetical protein
MKILIKESQYQFLIEQNSNYGFWDKVVDFFMPGTPVKDGRDLLKKFDDIIKRRIEFNKKNKLPLNTLTPEEKSFREKILKSTPNLNYPTIFGLSKIVQDINQGKNIRPEEFNSYVNPSFLSTTQKQNPKNVNKLLNSREELKKMWLGLDSPEDDSKGFWVKSEFKPEISTNPNDVYYKPKNIPKLTTQQFNELYNAILNTKLSNGKFPGGNSETILNNILDNKFKYITLNLFKLLSGDDTSSTHSMLGSFKLGAGVDGNRKYISIYDEWDLVPPSAKRFGVDVQKYGKTPLIYYRIYQ